MTRKFTPFERQRIQQLILESEIQGLDRDEMHALVKQRLGKDISLPYLDYVKRQNKERTHRRLEVLRKHRNAYIDFKFRHIEEIELYQRKLHELIKNNPNKPFLIKSCYDSLHDLTITKSDFIEMLPIFSGSETYAEETIPSEQDFQKQPTKF